MKGPIENRSRACCRLAMGTWAFASSSTFAAAAFADTAPAKAPAAETAPAAASPDAPFRMGRRPEDVRCPDTYVWDGSQCNPVAATALPGEPVGEETSGLNGLGVMGELIAVASFVGGITSASILTFAAVKDGQEHALVAPTWAVFGTSSALTVLSLAVALGPGSSDSNTMVFGPLWLVAFIGGVLELDTGIGFLTLAATTNHNHELVAPGWLMTAGGPILAVAIEAPLGLAIAARHEKPLFSKSAGSPAHRWELSLRPGPGQVGASLSIRW